MQSRISAADLLQLMKNNGKKEKNPIVFVPGMFGSMGDEIIPRTGKWRFGMAASIYEPFIKQLENLGYQKDTDLFIGFYDWRKNCVDCAKNYLTKTIEQAKEMTGSKKVDLVCHSMGGVVARAYAQGREYKGDIDQLIMIGTPNAGAVNAYFMWAGGELPYKGSTESDMFRSLLEGYLWLLKKYYKFGDDLETVHEQVQGVEDLLPCYQYGDYLYFQQNRFRSMSFIPYAKVHYKNELLDAMNRTSRVMAWRNIKVTLIAGKSVETNHYLEIDPKQRGENGRWIDGKVLEAAKSQDGDGTVLVNSVFAVEGDRYLLHGTHTGILEQCGFVLRKKLGVQQEYFMRSHEAEIGNHVNILIDGKGNSLIKAVDGKDTSILYDGHKSEDNVYVESYGEQLKWIMIVNPNYDRVFMDFTAEDNGYLDVMVKESSGRIKKVQSREVRQGGRYRIHIE